MICQHDCAIKTRCPSGPAHQHNDRERGDANCQHQYREAVTAVEGFPLLHRDSHDTKVRSPAACRNGPFVGEDSPIGVLTSGLTLVTGRWLLVKLGRFRTAIANTTRTVEGAGKKRRVPGTRLHMNPIA